MSPTVLTFLALGGLTQTLAKLMLTTAWVVGSFVSQGFVFFDTTNQGNPSIFSDTGAVLTFGGTASGQAGGGILLTASGSDTDYLVARYQVPSFYGSGAVVERVDFECGVINRLTTGSLVINQPGSAYGPTVGTVVEHQIRLGTGTYLGFATGALLNTKIQRGNYISFISARSGSLVIPPVRDCVMKPRLHEKHGR